MFVGLWLVLSPSALINPLSSPSLPSRRGGTAEPVRSFTSEAQTRSMFEKGCENCRKWQEHYYWEHMDVSKIRFFKFMTGDFAKSISVWEKFTRNFNGHITKGLDLKAPSGETWHIGIDRHVDELFLTSGWEDFVKAQELQENDLIVFTCSGKSSFQVLIFEAGGCEKVSSLFANRTSPNMCKHFNKVGGPAQHDSISDSDDTSMPSQLVGSPHKASTSKKPIGKKPRKESESPNSNGCHDKHEAMEQDVSDDIYANSNYYYSMFANRLTEEEKEEIQSLAPIRSENPAFVTILQKRQCQTRNNNLIVPKRFAADHFEPISQDIILCRPHRNGKWPVKYYYQRYTRCLQNLQLFNFVNRNKLREGDICLFELMKGAKKVTMTVHAIRNVDGRFVLLG
ncbi:hypothetical protein ACP4OV_022883 [Aristida adscensionis]